MFTQIVVNRQSLLKAAMCVSPARDFNNSSVALMNQRIITAAGVWEFHSVNSSTIRSLPVAVQQTHTKSRDQVTALCRYQVPGGRPADVMGGRGGAGQQSVGQTSWLGPY